MLSTGVHHVSVNVDDVEAGRAFYVDVLGMKVLPRPDLGLGGVWLAVGDQQIHLIELPPPAAQGQHFALRVDDIHAAADAIRAKGVAVTEPKQLADVCWQANLIDPAGNAIELNQPL
jgi:catechol 2,3-dioxygenase-like lactoylglutathione lyase family enzyme